MSESIKERTKVYFDRLDSVSLNELVTKAYQHRPIHVASNSDEVVLTIRMRPNKFTKANFGKNVNVVDSLVTVDVLLNGDEVTEKIYGLGTGTSPSQSVVEAVKNLTKPVDKEEVFELESIIV